MHAERLLVFAKAPEPGRVKTRLAERWGADVAARLHEAFLRDVLAHALASRRDVVLYHDPEEPGPVLARLGVALRPQRGPDLGARLAHAFRSEREAGAERVVVLGADSPDFPPGRLDQAFAALVRAAVVIAPATDGGYVLLGARVPPDALLEGIPWGTSQVLAATLARLRTGGLDAALLDAWYDVDRPEDLDFLRVHLDLLLETTGEDRCPATRRLLGTLAP